MRNAMKNTGNTYKRQSGVALAISLIILLVLTLVVVSSTQNVVVQERMASAVRDAHISLQGAEAGLKQAELVLFGTGIGADNGIIGLSNFDGTSGLFPENSGPTNVWDPNTWSGSVNTVTVAGNTVLFYIESLGQMPPEGAGKEDDLNLGGYGATGTEGTYYGFRVVSRAMGTSGTAERVVVAYYKKELDS